MNYLKVFTPNNIAKIYDLYCEREELLVHLEYPHSGGSGWGYFIRSFQHLKQLLLEQVHPEIEIYIFKTSIFPIRGIVGDKLLIEALEIFADGQSYMICSPNAYPDSCDIISSGSSHLELKKDFSQFAGKNVIVGYDYLDFMDSKWLFTHCAEVMYISVRKNQNFYKNYVDNPNFYQSIIDDWNS